MINYRLLEKQFNEAAGSERTKAKKLTESIMKRIEDGKATAIDYMSSIKGLHEAVGSKAFPVLTKSLLSKIVIDAYNAHPRVWRDLVTTYPSSLRLDTIPGAYLTQNMKKLAEGEPYPHNANIQEKFVTVGTQKYGVILDITEEMIKHDQSGLVILRAQAMGETAAKQQEMIIMKSILDYDGYKVYYPGGTQSDLYQNAGAEPHTQDNLITNALSDWTDIDAARLLLKDMTDENGDPIDPMATTMLVPNALYTKARMLISNTVLPDASNNEMNPFAGSYKIVETPYMSSITEWYLGDFKKQFGWKEVMPLEVMTRDGSQGDGWERDVKYQFKVRMNGQAFAKDYKYVIKSTGVA
jgi:hypothetical protein